MVTLSTSLRAAAIAFTCTAVAGFSPAAQGLSAMTGSSGETISNPLANLNVELPEFESMFKKIQRVSPLARSVIETNDLESNRVAEGMFTDTVMLVPYNTIADL